MQTATPTNAKVTSQVVSQSEWLTARKELLEKEKEFTRKRDEFSRLRRELPRVRVEENYQFDSPKGKVTLSDLFAGRSQLVVYHFMFGPGWEHGCPSCSYLMDHIDGAIPHLNARDVSFTAVSHAPLAEFEPFKKRLGWKFPWVSSFGSKFNFDFLVSFTKEQIAKGDVFYNFANMGGTGVEELPGLSVFYKDSTGAIFHTYSTYARGLDLLVGTYNYLDLVPKGRDEEGFAHSMTWVRFHDEYRSNYTVDPTANYEPPKGSICPNCCGADKS